MITYVKEFVHSTSTAVDALSGTPVSKAGPRGYVEAAFASSDGSNQCTLKAREGGAEIIPEASAPNIGAAGNTQSIGLRDFIYRGFVPGGSELDLDVFHSGANVSLVAIRTE